MTRRTHSNKAAEFRRLELRKGGKRKADGPPASSSFVYSHGIRWNAVVLLCWKPWHGGWRRKTNDATHNGDGSADYRRVVATAHLWQGTGFLKPSGKGTGHRRYTFPDVVAVKTVMALRRQGCSLQQIRKAVAHLRKRYPHDAGPEVLASLTLLTDGKSVYMLSDAQAVMAVVSKQTVWWVVNVGKLILEARQAMQAMPLEWVEPVTVREQAFRLRVSHDADEIGYVVQCVELPGAIEQGETADEAIENGKVAKMLRADLADAKASWVSDAATPAE